MGEAMYYLKARCASQEAAIELEGEFRALLDDLVLLNRDWQRIRNQADRTCGARRAELTANHALAASLLEGHTCLDGSDRYMNCLAGTLPDMTENYLLRRTETTLLLSDAVWHFTEWDALVRWLEQRNARATYVSDEEVDPFELL